METLKDCIAAAEIGQPANPIQELLDMHHKGYRWVKEMEPGHRSYTYEQPLYFITGEPAEHIRYLIAQQAIERTAETAVQYLDRIKPECLVGLTVQDLIVLGQAVETYSRIS